MPVYAFGFKTQGINEVGECFYSGDGSDLEKAISNHADRGYVRIGRTLANPALIPIAVPDPKILKAQAEERKRVEDAKTARLKYNEGTAPKKEPEPEVEQEEQPAESEAEADEGEEFFTGSKSKKKSNK